MSSNPFRKKAPGAIDTSRTGSPKSSMRTEDAHAIGDRRNKPAKKVRVLSPPPLSPDSPEWPSDVPQPPTPLSNDNYSYTNYHPSYDPFNGASTDESDRDSAITPPPPQPQHQQWQHQGGTQAGGIPANPFSKTLQDIEGSKELQKERRDEGEALKAANEERKSLNVDSFKRLLMTGNAGDDALSVSTDPEAEVPKMSTQHTSQKDSWPKSGKQDHAESSADSSSQEDNEDRPRAHAESSQPASKEKKLPPPPPPSSRHGKSLKQQQLKDAEADRGNGPGPMALSSRNIDDAETASDIEAPKASGAEADPEPQLNHAHTWSGARKSAPTPPPPRGHARTDSRSYDNEAPRRTSSEEAVPTRSDSMRSTGAAPAPPPPRRPYTVPKTGTISSPSISSSNVASSTDQETSQSLQDTATSTKPSVAPQAPPRPPTRQPSTRRPPSVSSVDAPSRRISSENKARDGMQPPPPPPPRNRGSSPNTDGSRKASGEAHGAGSGNSADILADLDALRREVDALRGQMK